MLDCERLQQWGHWDLTTNLIWVLWEKNRIKRETKVLKMVIP